MINVPSALNSLESKVDKLDVYKLVPVSVDLKKLSDVLEKMLLKGLYMINSFKKLMPWILLDFLKIDYDN